RYLMPALHLLLDAGKLPEGFRILGIAREKWSTTFFRRRISERLDRHAGGLAPASRNAFISSLEYRSDDVTDRDQAARALGQIDEPIVAYLLPPSIFAPTIKVLAVAELPKR
ncbi:MAG: glucose-6-phosphate dehydrogenase, partial [Nitrospiraceae bacterium]